jgi:hypothetical protein
MRFNDRGDYAYIASWVLYTKDHIVLIVQAADVMKIA